jgi:hypothetical protein
MLLLVGSLLVLFSIAVVLLMPALWAREIHHAYSGPRAVTCPETHQQVGVTIDATHAAATGFRGTPEFRLSDCSRWPARIQCGQGCLPEALRNEPYELGEVQPSRTARQIYHLPVLLAAFAAWYVGMVWHSQYLFRERWMTALGLTPDQLKQMIAWYSPHLLSIAACLLFAYGVAWVQTWFSRKGVWEGILSSTLLWAAVLLVTLSSMISVSRDLLLIEVSYTLVASIVVGAILGGLSGKLVLPALKPDLPQRC